MVVNLSILSSTRLLHTGTNGNDSIVGDVLFEGTTRPDDEIHGRGGDDSMNGGLGQNDLLGQNGDDGIAIGYRPEVIYDRGFGGNGNDTFNLYHAPTHGRRIHLVDGGNGIEDVVYFSTNFGRLNIRNEIVRVPGDRIARLENVERLNATSHDDIIYLSGSLEWVNGFAGNDRIDASDLPSYSVVSIAGGSGDDVLIGGDGLDTLMDGTRLVPDQLQYNFFDQDILRGGANTDVLISQSGDDFLDGGAGGDLLYSISGVDRLRGGDGNDWFQFTYPGMHQYPSHGAQSLTRAQAALTGLSINGGDGTDTVDLRHAYTSPSMLDTELHLGVRIDLAGGFGVELGTGTNGRFRIRDVENLIGTAQNDILRGTQTANELIGNAGDDRLFGRDGDDILLGRNGDDQLLGGGGVDDIDGDNGDDVIDGGAGDDLLSGNAGNDRLQGGSGNDEIFAGAGNDRLSGDAGRDTLRGGSGNDTITGGTGNDVMFGDGGRDTFVFGGADGGGSDTIADFSVGVDVIRIPGASFNDLTILDVVGTPIPETRVTYYSGEITLVGVDASTLTQASFEFL